MLKSKFKTESGGPCPCNHSMALFSDCPSQMKALAVILSVIGAVLAVALALLLIWRVLATIQVRISVTYLRQRARTLN